MMIKQLHKYQLLAALSILFCGLCLSSCGEDFLSTVPDNASTIEEQLNTKEDARKFLNAAYDALSFGNVYGGQFALVSELMADGIDGQNLDGDWNAHYTRSTGIFVGTTRNMMHDGFKAVARANNVLRRLDAISDMSETEKSQFEGEAKFIRAMIHFDLLRFFAQPYGYSSDNSHLGIAIRTTFSTDLVNRSSVADVYAQVISDLESAESLLPANNGNYADQYAAKALLAQVYFQMNDFGQAFAYADEVISNSGNTFDDDHRAKYGFGNTNELIFSLVSTDIGQDNSNGEFRNYFRIDPSTNSASVLSSESIFNASTLDPNDLRGLNWFNQPGEQIFCEKFRIDSIYANPVIHLTEMYFIRAESALENGDTESAVNDLNMIRDRAGLTSLSASASSGQVLQTIRDDRRIELYFENDRLHELKRIAVHDSPDMVIRGADWDCPGMVCQIPDNELTGNPDMEPNPEAGC